MHLLLIIELFYLIKIVLQVLFNILYFLDNIVLNKDGHIMLTDFGLSKEGVLDC